MKYITFNYWCISDFHDTTWYLQARSPHRYPDIMHGLHPTLSWLNNCLITFLNFFSLQLLLYSCVCVCVCVGGWLAMQHTELPWQGIEPMPPALGAHSLNHWTTNGARLHYFLFFLLRFWFHVLGGGGDIQGDGEGRVWSLSVWFYTVTVPHNHGQACLFISQGWYGW